MVLILLYVHNVNVAKKALQTCSLLVCVCASVCVHAYTHLCKNTMYYTRYYKQKTMTVLFKVGLNIQHQIFNLKLFIEFKSLNSLTHEVQNAGKSSKAAKFYTIDENLSN